MIPQDEDMLKPALTRYRVIAYVVGVLLIVLTIGTIMKYAGGSAAIVAIVGPIHGFLYMVYLVLAFLLARQARWGLWFTLLILLAGTVPFLTFVAERAVVRRVAAAEPVPSGQPVSPTVGR
jgi:integral membrane protein